MENENINTPSLGTIMEVDIDTAKQLKIPETIKLENEKTNTLENETSETMSLELPTIIKTETTDIADFETIPSKDYGTKCSGDGEVSECEYINMTEIIKSEMTNDLDTSSTTNSKNEISEIIETENRESNKEHQIRRNTRGRKNKIQTDSVNINTETKTRHNKPKGTKAIMNIPKSTTDKNKPKTRAGRGKVKTRSSEYKLRTRAKATTNQNKPKTRESQSKVKARSSENKLRTRAKATTNGNKPKTKPRQNMVKTRPNEYNPNKISNQGSKATKTRNKPETRATRVNPKRTKHQNKSETTKQNKLETKKLDTTSPAITEINTLEHDAFNVHQTESELTSEKGKANTQNRPKSRNNPRLKQQYQCGTCKLMFNTRWDVEKHKNEVHRTYVGAKCEECGKTDFQSYVAYQYHVRLHASRLNCEHCGKPFISRAALKAHSTTAVIDEKCAYCPEMFTRKCVLTKHINSDHAEEVDKRKTFACSVCGKRYMTREDKSRHEKRTHRTKKEQMQCSECGAQVLNLKQHIKYNHPKLEEPTSSGTVSDVKTILDVPYRSIQCDFCGKIITQKQDYLEHRATHLGTALYLCEYCGKTFKKRSNLRTHLLSHTGDRPCKCAHCPKGFMTPEDLNRHVRTHTGEKPFKCDLCDRAFAQKGALNSHKKKKHT